MSVFRTQDQPTFRAHIIGLKNHRAECTEKLCEICKFGAAVANYTWDARNYSRYLKEASLVVWQDQLNISDRKESKDDEKKISFSGFHIVNKKQKGFHLNMLSLEKACFYNTSMVETALIQF